MKIKQAKTKTTPVKKLSNYELSELAALLYQIRGSINDYSHVTDNGQIENLVNLLKSTHENLCAEIDRREEQ